jgi:transposase
MEPGTPFGASVQSLATYLRYTHAIGYERLSGLFAQVFGLGISEGGLAHLFQAVNGRLDDRVAEILTRLRSSRLIGSDEPSARVSGQQQWAWVFQNTEVCIHVIRPSRGQGVIQEVLGRIGRRFGCPISTVRNRTTRRAMAGLLAHQLRDCQFAIDAGDAVLAPRMKAVFLRAFASHQRRDTSRPPPCISTAVICTGASPAVSRSSPPTPRQTAAETLCEDPGPFVPLFGRCHHSPRITPASKPSA